MKVISKKSTKKLVKGGEYEIFQLWNDGSSRSRYLEGSFEIKGLGRFKVDDFHLQDGSPLPKSIISHDRDFSHSLRKGSVLVPNRDLGKSFIKGKMYVVEDIKFQNRTLQYGGRVVQDKYLKFQGFKRWYKFNYWNFDLLPIEKHREISLSEILDSKKSPIIINKSKRSFDDVDNKDQFLIQILFGSIADKYRNNLNILDWAVSKTGSKYGIVKSDFDGLMNEKIIDLVNKFDNQD